MDFLLKHNLMSANPENNAKVILLKVSSWKFKKLSKSLLDTGNYCLKCISLDFVPEKVVKSEVVVHDSTGVNIAKAMNSADSCCITSPTKLCQNISFLCCNNLLFQVLHLFWANFVVPLNKRNHKMSYHIAKKSITEVQSFHCKMWNHFLSYFNIGMGIN